MRTGCANPGISFLGPGLFPDSVPKADLLRTIFGIAQIGDRHALVKISRSRARFPEDAREYARGLLPLVRKRELRDYRRTIDGLAKEGAYESLIRLAQSCDRLKPSRDYARSRMPDAVEVAVRDRLQILDGGDHGDKLRVMMELGGMLDHDFLCPRSKLTVLQALKGTLDGCYETLSSDLMDMAGMKKDYKDFLKVRQPEARQKRKLRRS